MRTNLEKKGDMLIVKVFGELDHHVAKEVREEIDEQLLFDVSIRDIQFDLKDMTFMDSSGIGVFMGRFKIVEKRGGGIYVCNVRPQVQKLLNISGLMNIITVV